MGDLAGANLSAVALGSAPECEPLRAAVVEEDETRVGGAGGRRRRAAAPGAREATTRDRTPRTGAAQKAGRHLLASPARSRPTVGGAGTGRLSPFRACACARLPEAPPQTASNPLRRGRRR